MHCITFRTESNRNKNKAVAAKEVGKKKTMKETEVDEEGVQTQAASQVRGKRGRRKK